MTKSKFTDREIKLLVAESKNRKEIAEALGVNEATAGRHLKRLGLRLKDITPEEKKRRTYLRENAARTDAILHGKACTNPDCPFGQKLQSSRCFRLIRKRHFSGKCRTCERRQNRGRFRITEVRIFDDCTEVYFTAAQRTFHAAIGKTFQVWEHFPGGGVQKQLHLESSEVPRYVGGVHVKGAIQKNLAQILGKEQE